jgi:hypothetical protein
MNCLSDTPSNRDFSIQDTSGDGLPPPSAVKSYPVDESNTSPSLVLSFQFHTLANKVPFCLPLSPNAGVITINCRSGVNSSLRSGLSMQSLSNCSGVTFRVVLLTSSSNVLVFVEVAIVIRPPNSYGSRIVSLLLYLGCLNFFAQSIDRVGS